jgi:hypothetical protein
MKEPVCTECGVPIEPNTSYLVGQIVTALDDAGKTVRVTMFGWACEHHPKPEADIILGSNDCVVGYARKHPQHEAVILQILAKVIC